MNREHRKRDDHLTAAGYRVALVRHLGGPAVIIGQSISGGAATIAAATAPDAINGLVELAPFTRKQSIDLRGLVRVQRYRAGLTRLMGAGLFGSVSSWKKYLDLAYPTKPADWDTELVRMENMLREPGRMKVLQAMGRSDPDEVGLDRLSMGLVAERLGVKPLRRPCART